MTLALYLDEDASEGALVEALRRRGIDVVTADECGNIERSDEFHLAFATSHRRVLVSSNIGHFMNIHRSWLETSQPHHGIVLVRQQTWGVGERARRLTRIAEWLTQDEMRNRYEFLTAW